MYAPYRKWRRAYRVWKSTNPSQVGWPRWLALPDVVGALKFVELDYVSCKSDLEFTDHDHSKSEIARRQRSRRARARARQRL